MLLLLCALLLYFGSAPEYCMAAPPTDFNKELEASIMAIRKNDFRSAFSRASVALGLNPRSDKAQYLKARALFMQHDETKALLEYQRYLAMNPSNDGLVAALTDMAVCAFNSENVQQALSYLDRAISVKPTTNALLLRAQIYRTLRNETKAEVDLKRAILLSPSDYSTMRELVLCWIVKGKLKDALKLNEQLTKLRPERSEPYMLRARICTALGNTRAAKESIEQARKCDNGF